MKMSETFPFRLRVLRALTDRLSSISPATGYVNDLDEAVFRGRIAFGENDPDTMLSILEPPLPPEPIVTPQKGKEQISIWELLIQGFVPDDKEHPTDPAHILLADVRKMLTVIRGEDPDILGQSKRVREITLGSPIVRPPDEISSSAYFYLPVQLKISEDLSDPYL
jgi:hypothetical protein